jgi:pentatricopeptide repeat protein
MQQHLRPKFCDSAEASQAKRPPMSARPIINDALWRCLCPSFASNSAVRSSRPAVPRLPNRNALRSPHRSISTNPPGRYDALNTDALAQPDPFSHNPIPPARAPWNRNKPEKPSLVHLQTPELYERLRSDAAAGRHADVFKIIKILIKDRREKPNVRLYAGLLHSYADPLEGTAGKIRKTLEEMGEEGIDLDAGACHCTLEALAVHPDYILREEILAYMKERWFTLSDRGHNMVVAGLLRDRLFEQAVGKIEEMLQQRIVVADWLLDKAIWILLDYGEVEEAWQLLLVRQQIGRSSLSQALWGQFLDVAGRMSHVEAANHIWTTRVGPGYLKPATATCMHILNMASRTGNVKLATDVFRVLSERDITFTSHHYEPLLEAYLKVDDLDAALSVILIMAGSGITVDEASIHPLYIYLKHDASRPLTAFAALQNFESTGRKVPTASINACLQASIHHDNLEEAIEIYKALHTVSRAGPNTQTFNLLFQGCHKAGRKELAMFLVSEMSKLGLKADAITYDRLVLVCCNADDLTDAFSYYEEMRDQGFEPRRGMFEVLIAKGVEMGDVRTPTVLEDMKRCGHVPYKETMMKVRDRFERVDMS